ncbi:MAG: hypothetical protein ACOX3R_09950 [Desulfitobacteriia bacterium]|jgi:hypothetical protein
MENIVYYIWFFMALFIVAIGISSVILRKIKGQQNTLANRLFSSGIVFTVFMLVSSIVIYQHSGMSLSFILTLVLAIGGVFMVISRRKKRQ